MASQRHEKGTRSHKTGTHIYNNVCCRAEPRCNVVLGVLSIDYTKTKTIQIADFPIRSSYVWGPMGPMFNNALKDMYANHTRLIQVRRNGDLKIEGEITQYTQRNKSVSSEGHSAQTELSITVNVRFTNNVNHNDDFEQQFTASKTYETTQSLNSVQEELVTQMVKDLTEQIFNATVANW